MANYPYLPIEEFKPKLLNSIFKYASELFDKNPNPNEDELKSINKGVNKRANNFCKINGYRKTFTVNIEVIPNPDQLFIITPSVKNYTLEVLEPKQKLII